MTQVQEKRILSDLSLSGDDLRAVSAKKLCNPRGNLLRFALRISKVITFMSQHRSLKGTSTIAAKRNVLKRFERVELLKKRGQFKPDQRVIGLPKTKPDA